MTTVTLSGPQLSAEIASRGGELVRLRDGEGRDLLWHGDPTWWGGRSPLLFPIVGRLPGDQTLFDGRVFRMPQHGFARTSDFICTQADAAACAFELASCDATRVCYPYDFRLRIAYAIVAATLTVTATVTNVSPVPMPFSFGFHPAFLWPLAPGLPRTAHVLEFERDEPAATFRPDPGNGLLAPTPHRSPVAGGKVALTDDLFADGAVIFTSLASRIVTLTALGGPGIRVAFHDLPHLGLWSKPGAPFVCIEPWQGYATPVGFTGELRDKPGILSLAPNTSRTFRMDITVLAA